MWVISVIVGPGAAGAACAPDPGRRCLSAQESFSDCCVENAPGVFTAGPVLRYLTAAFVLFSLGQYVADPRPVGPQLGGRSGPPAKVTFRTRHQETSWGRTEHAEEEPGVVFKNTPGLPQLCRWAGLHSYFSVFLICVGLHRSLGEQQTPLVPPASTQVFSQGRALHPVSRETVNLCCCTVSRGGDDVRQPSFVFAERDLSHPCYRC